jgi:hypothetical protein
MINLYHQVPSIYTSTSRDFQYLSWLYNIVLNSVKHNIDDIYNLPNIPGDTKLTELLAMTLGFKVKRHYDQKQLTALVAILHSALRYKGTEKAVLMAAEALVKAMGSLGEANVEVEGTEIIVTLPKDLVDITLFLDVLDYILPAGMTCRVIRKNQKTENIESIKVKYHDKIRLLVEDDLRWEASYDFDQEEHISQSKGLSDLYNIDNNSSGFSTTNVNVDDTLNAGLLDNTIIPVIAGAAPAEVPTTVALFSTEEDGSHKRLLVGQDEASTKELRAKKNLLKP